jgi:hypothetical protein
MVYTSLTWAEIFIMNGYESGDNSFNESRCERPSVGINFNSFSQYPITSRPKHKIRAPTQSLSL